MSIARSVSDENRNMLAINGEPEPWTITRRFSDLFAAYSHDAKNRPQGARLPGGPEIGPYLLISDHRKPRTGRDYSGSCWVQAQPFLVEWISENMLNISHDNIYFEAILRNDGSCLLVAQHNQIIASGQGRPEARLT